MKASSKTKKRKSTSVPGQALGYFLQETKMTELLARSPAGHLVSLEVIDDVAVHAPDGGTKMVQTKSALTANPISDHALVFWKTLANWAEDLAKENDFSKLKLILYVSNPRTGAIAEKLSKAYTNQDIADALKEARSELSTELGAPANNEKDLAFHVRRFFAISEPVRNEIIRCFSIETGNVSPHEDLPKCFPFVDKTQIDNVVAHALGWVKRQAELLMEQRKSAILSRDEFHQEMTSYIRKHRERAILRSVASSEIPKEKEAELLPRPFVQQLEIIGAGFDDRLRAVSDFFRATYDRAQWGASGEVHPDSFDELDDRLKRTWANLKRISEIRDKASGEKERGLLLFSECSSHTDSLENQEVPNHFVPGCFHQLADNQSVGWHPRYKDLLVAKEPAVTT